MPDPKARRGLASPPGGLLGGGGLGGGPLGRAMLLVPLVLGGLALLLQVKEEGERARGRAGGVSSQPALFLFLTLSFALTHSGPPPRHPWRPGPP